MPDPSTNSGSPRAESRGDWTPELRRRLDGLGLSPEREAEILEEISQHLDDREAELRRTGVGVAEARRLALDEISDDELLRGEFSRLRHARAAAPPPPGLPASRLLEHLWQDVRYGARALVQRPAFSLAATCALALGIGATSAIFGAVDTVLLRPMPFPHADRLYVPISVNTARRIDQGSITFADYADWRAESAVFAEVALWRPIDVDITGDGAPERVEIAQVSEEFFRLIDVTPFAGRTLTASDHVAGAPLVVVISNGLWQRRFGGASDVIGRTLRIAGQPSQIVGVLPARAVWPDTAQLFVPMKPSSFNDNVRTRRDNMIFQGLARLREDVTEEAANARLGAMAARLEQADPTIRKGWTNVVIPLRAYMVDGDLRTALYLLLGAVCAVMLIACANVANLALVRGSGRVRELAVRLSLGASRSRLIQQIAIEGALLAATGAAVGAGLAVLIMKGLVAIAPDGAPFVDEIHMNPRVLAATVVVGVLAALVSGLLPALSSSIVHLGAALRESSTGSGTSRRAARLRNVLVVVEVAAAVVLVTGSALLIRSFDRLSRVDAGVALDRVVSGRVSIPSARYNTGAKRAQFVQSLVAALDAEPDVESSALTSFVPVGGGGFGLGRVFLTEGRPEPPAGPDVGAQWNVITPAYFRTMGIRLRQGREFDDRDTEKSTPVVIVTDSFVRQMFPGESPIGRRVRSWRDENVLREIVGVVDDVKYEGLADRERALVYIPHAQDSWGSLLIVARARRGDPAALAPTVRRVVGVLDPNLAVADVRSLAETARRSVASQRYAMLLLTILAGVALALSALGIYGVTSYVFTLRRREMGIRLALGASRTNLYGLVIRHGVGLALVGLVLGVAGSAAATQVLRSLLFATSPSDATAWTGMVGIVLAAACLACILPARRAADADPTGALRAE